MNFGHENKCGSPELWEKRNNGILPAPGGACSGCVCVCVCVCGDPPVTGTTAGGTHPTGMHSC